MKKSLVIGSILLLVGSSAFAGKSGDMAVGFEFGGLKSDATSSANGVKADGDLSTTYEAIRVGKYYDFGRIGANAGLMNKDNGTDGKFMGASYDYMFYNNSQFTPFIGANLSYSWNEANYNIKHDGWLFGPEVGIVYDFSDKVELEVGVRYLKSNIDGSKNISGTNVKIDVDSVVQYYVGVSYKF